MAAPKGNTYWKSRKDISDDGKKLSIDELIEKTQEYFQHVEDNPLMKVEIVICKGVPKQVKAPKMRPFTLTGLYAYLGITNRTWSNWKGDVRYSNILVRIENIIYVQQFEGAAVGFFNPVIISRKLSLTDKKDVTSGGKPISTKGEVILPNGKSLDDYI
ncbi:terminase small subunit [Flagellimonas aurea]|uniref:terminase small subunit n=1 Tax=Flagellimonas aurea TaxID=2915619 RepID=UPI0035CEF6D9